MSGYLARLSALTLGAVPVLRPTSAARYGARPEIAESAAPPGPPAEIDRVPEQRETPSSVASETPVPSMPPKEERRLLPLREERDVAGEMRPPVEKEAVRVETRVRIETKDDAREPATERPARVGAARRRRDRFESVPSLAQAQRDPAAGADSGDLPETTVHVHIGRIDVRAVQSPERRSAAPPTGTLVKPSLDAHLKRRDRGRP